jgi:RNA polymerase sigma-70 factor (ECF subfamily)
MSQRVLPGRTSILEAGRVAAPPARFEQLFAQHYRWVWRTLRRLGVEERLVDDAAQQVFLVLSTRLDGVPENQERSFLMGTMLRIAANCRRSAARSIEVGRDVLAEASPAPNPEQLLDWKQRRERLDVWLDGLGLELRAPFVLFELEGLGVAEVASLLDLPLGTVKTRLRRARALFVAFVTQSGEAP